MTERTGWRRNGAPTCHMDTGTHAGDQLGGLAQPRRDRSHVATSGGAAAIWPIALAQCEAPDRLEGDHAQFARVVSVEEVGLAACPAAPPAPSSEFSAVTGCVVRDNVYKA